MTTMSSYGVNQEFLENATAIDQYIISNLLPHDTGLSAALENNQSSNLDSIDVAPNQGKMLYLSAKMIRAKRILEVGTLGGYSAIWLAKAVGATGKVVTLEIDPEHARVAQENIAFAGFENVVDVKTGPALDTLQAMQTAGTEDFDMVFIDADKQNNVGYFKAALAFSHVGTVIIVDNVGRRGKLSDESVTDISVVGTRNLFQYLKEEKRVEATAVQTVGCKGWDGYLMALVVA